MFFDQRGVGTTAPLQCRQAALQWFGTDDSPTGTTAEAEAYAADTEQFVADCVAETGVPADEFQYYSTKQAVEDLEVFRAWDGADKLILYGESYGTQYAQEYTAAHPDHVQALIIDGPVDLTHSGTDYYAETAHTAADVLKLILDDCTDDPHCAADVDGGDATAAYDALAAQLAAGPASFDYVTSTGDVERRSLTLNDLESAMDYALTPSADRMFLQRVIAQASHGELQPLAHLLYAALGQDPDTLSAIPDPTWSDAMYFSVDCSDYAFGSGTAEERSAAYFAAGQAAGVERHPAGGWLLPRPPLRVLASTRPRRATDVPGRGITYPVFILGRDLGPLRPVPERRAPGREHPRFVLHRPARWPARHLSAGRVLSRRRHQRVPAGRDAACQPSDRLRLPGSR